jgi:hypothetical protein
MRRCSLAVFCLVVHPFSTFAEVTNVTITSRTVVANGHSFGSTGPYEKLVGRIEFALDPKDRHNAQIADLAFAPRDTDGRVRFSSDLMVIQPTDPAKGNGVLLFEAANRGSKILVRFFNRGTRSDSPSSLEDFGDGLLMREGYTIVWVGWEFDAPATSLHITPPPAVLPPNEKIEPLNVDILVNARTPEAFLVDDPARPPIMYPPADPTSAADRLTVRDHFWDEPTVIPREQWRFVSGGTTPPKLHLEGGFDPGRWYRVTYRPTGAVVGGVGLAAFRDAAAAFRYRTDLPVHGRAAYAYGQSQTGRFLRQFLYDGFNVDERDRRVFDAVWAHIAGAALGSYNERFATPIQGDFFRPTQFPFADAEETDTTGARGGLQLRYRPDQQAKVFYTNTPVEYWGGGRAAALTHTSVDGARDLALPGNVRMYFLPGTQHLVAPFPPLRTPEAGQVNAFARSDGQQLSNPTPQDNIMRGLLRALHEWVADGTPPPPSRYPRLGDHTLVRVQDVKFPALPGVADPRGIVGPGRLVNGKMVPLPFLVPQVDSDGNDIAGLHDPEAAVPLATTTGWNFRREAVGNPSDIYITLGSYIPFATTRATRKTGGDPRMSIEERYRSLDDYLGRIRSAAMDLIRGRYMLQEDLDGVLARAKSHWSFATRDQSVASVDRR